MSCLENSFSGKRWTATGRECIRCGNRIVVYEKPIARGSPRDARFVWRTRAASLCETEENRLARHGRVIAPPREGGMGAYPPPRGETAGRGTQGEGFKKTKNFLTYTKLLAKISCYHIYVEKRMQRKKAAAREKKDLCGGKRGCRECGGSARRRRGLYREIFIDSPSSN